MGFVLTKLRFFKDLAQKRKLLTSAEIKIVLKGLDSKEELIKIETYRIIRYLVENGQDEFDSGVLKKIKKELAEENSDIKGSLFTIVGILLKKSSDASLKFAYFESFASEVHKILNSLSDASDGDGLDEQLRENWLRVLEKLANHPHIPFSLKSRAQITMSKISKAPDLNLDKELAQSLIFLIKDRSYPQEARVNAFIIFTRVVRQKGALVSEVLNLVVADLYPKLLDHDLCENLAAKRGILFILSVCVTIAPQDNFLEKVINFLGESYGSQEFHEASFVGISALVKRKDLLPPHRNQLIKIFQKAESHLRDFTSVFLQDALLLFRELVLSQWSVPEYILETIAAGLRKGYHKECHQEMLFFLKEAKGNRFSGKIIQELLESLSQSSDDLSAQIESLLMCRMADSDYNSQLVGKLINFLENPSLEVAAINILEKLSFFGPFHPDFIYKISQQLKRSEKENQLKVLSFLRNCLRFSLLENRVLVLLQENILEEKNDITLSILDLLEQVLGRPDAAKIYLSLSVCEQIVGFLEDSVLYEPALNVVTNLSNKGLDFGLTVFYKIFDLFLVQMDFRLMRLLNQQLPYHAEYFKDAEGLSQGCQHPHQCQCGLISRISVIEQLFFLPTLQSLVVEFFAKISLVTPIILSKDIMGAIVNLSFEATDEGLRKHVNQLMVTQKDYHLKDVLSRLFEMKAAIDGLSDAVNGKKNKKINEVLKKILNFLGEGYRVSLEGFAVLQTMLGECFFKNPIFFDVLLAIAKSGSEFPVAFTREILSLLSPENFISSGACDLFLILNESGFYIEKEVFSLAEQTLYAEYESHLGVHEKLDINGKLGNVLKKIDSLLIASFGQDFLFKEKTINVFFQVLFLAVDESLKNTILKLLKSIAFRQKIDFYCSVKNINPLKLKNYLASEKASPLVEELVFVLRPFQGSIAFPLDSFLKNKKSPLKNSSSSTTSVHVSFSRLEAISIALTRLLLKTPDEVLGHYTPMLILRGKALIRLGWSLKELEDFLEKALHHFKREDFFEKQGECYFYDIIAAFDICLSYKSVSEETFYSRLKNQGFGEFQKSLRMDRDKPLFSISGEAQSLESLITAGKKMKPMGQASSEEVSDLFYPEMIRNIYREVDEYYDSSTGVQLPSGFISKLPISQWRKDKSEDPLGQGNIITWVGHIVMKKELSVEVLLPEYLAVIKRVCFFHDGTIPYDAQILSLISLVCVGKDSGRFLEVPPSAGKTKIIAMFSAIYALRGEKVDVISNEVLAQRDAENYKHFYTLLNLKVASNEDYGYRGGMKPCYHESVHIIYGGISAFQFDYLREKYEGTGVRGGRKFGFVVIDEVDSTLVDEGARVAMLASVIPGMDQLQFLMRDIWDELVHTLIQLKKSRPNIGNEELVGIVYARLDNFINAKLGAEEKNFPSHLKDFILNQKPRWIDSALMAYFFVRSDVAYLIKEVLPGFRSVMPVDADNTGVVQRGTSWNYGLQQFLQLKNGLPFTPETLTTNFISNHGFITECYGGNIRGLTGTLGSEDTRFFLSQAYHQKIDFAQSASQKVSQGHELAWVIAPGQNEWFEEVVRDVMTESSWGRAVLVICKNIQIARNLQKILKQRDGAKVIKEYVDSESRQNQFLENAPLQPGVIVVATNLAGRGTDTQLSGKVLERGGLHVCFTYLPKNLRVYFQGIHRAARRGEPGTSRLIVNREDFESLDKNFEALARVGFDHSWMHSAIKKYEHAQIQDLLTCSFPNTLLKDDLFKKYATLQEKLRRESKKVSHSGVTSSFDFSLPGYVRAKHDAIEERWGIWFSRFQDQLSNKDIVYKEFEMFEQEITKEYFEEKVIKNPFYFVRAGNSELFSGKSSACKRSALALYDEAIKLDSNCYIARYNKARIFVELKEPKENYRALAKAELLLVARALQKNIFAFKHSLSWAQTQSHAENFQQQLRYQWYNLMELEKSVSRLLTAIDRSEKLVDITVGNSSYIQLKKEQLSAYNFKKNAVFTFHDLVTNADGHQVSRFVEFLRENLEIKLEVTISSRLLKTEDEQAAMLNLLPINRKIKTTITATSKKQGNDQGWLAAAKSGIKKVGSAPRKAVEKVGVAWNENIRFDYKKAEDLNVQLYYPGRQLKEAAALIASIKSEVDLGLDLCFDGLSALLVKEWVLSISDKVPYHQSLSIEEEVLEEQDGVAVVSVRQHFPKTFNKEFGVFSVIFKKLDLNHSRDLLIIASEVLKSYGSRGPQISQDLSSFVNLTFSSLSQEKAESIIQVGGPAFEMTFVELGYEAARGLVDLLDRDNQNASFKFSNVSCDIAEKFIRAHQNITRPDFDVYTTKSEDSLAKGPFFELERDRLYSCGLIFYFDAKIRKPIPWKSLAAVAGIAVLQFATGAVLTIFTAGFGAALGMSLMLEPLSDIIQIGLAIRRRDFSWGSYTVQKLAGLTMAFATAGFSTLASAKAGVMAAEEIGASGMSLAAQRGANVGVAVADDAANLAQKTITMLHNFGKETLVSAIKESSKICVEAAQDVIMSQVVPEVLESLRTSFNILMGRNSSLGKSLEKIFIAEKLLKTNEYSDELVFDAQEFFSDDDLKSSSSLDLSNLEKFETIFSGKVEACLKRLDVLPRFFVKNAQLSENMAFEVINFLRFKKVLDQNDGFDLSKIFKGDFSKIDVSGRVLQIDDNIKYVSESEFDFQGLPEEARPFKLLILETCQKLALVQHERFYWEHEALKEKIFKELSARVRINANALASKVSGGVALGLNIGIDSGASQVVSKLSKKDSSSGANGLGHSQAQVLAAQVEKPKKSLGELVKAEWRASPLTIAQGAVLGVGGVVQADVLEADRLRFEVDSSVISPAFERHKVPSVDRPPRAPKKNRTTSSASEPHVHSSQGNAGSTEIMFTELVVAKEGSKNSAASSFSSTATPSSQGRSWAQVAARSLSASSSASSTLFSSAGNNRRQGLLGKKFVAEIGKF